MIVATVPSVTIARITRGVQRKIRPDSRYFPYYTRPWITDDAFDLRHDPYLTGDEARAIDSAIDAYNETIIASVARPAATPRLVPLRHGLAPRPARHPPLRREPLGPPDLVDAVRAAPALLALDPVPSTRFFRSGPEGRTEGGLFSLDGVHPTTIGYGILAQEVIRVMELAGVAFLSRDGRPRPGPVTVDFERLLRADTLISDPPASVGSTLGLLGWLDQRLDWVRTFLPFVPSPL